MSMSDLIERVMALMVGAPIDLAKIRADIHEEHGRATTERDREVLLDLHKTVMDTFARQIREEDLEAFRKTRREDYNFLLIKEAMIGDTSGLINPQRLAPITQREVEAGRSGTRRWASQTRCGRSNCWHWGRNTRKA
jgi:hypothetical protein